MDLKLAEKRVLVTGGSKGIGLACARAFLDEGCSVVLVARDGARLKEAAVELCAGDRVVGFAADLSDAVERQRMAAAFPDIDILVNNAGAIPGGGLLDLSMETWTAAWNLKVMGYIHLTQLFLAQMKERRAGAIVNIIGAAGRNPRYDYVCGGTGNAALMAFTGAVGGKSTEWGVRVFGINPSMTRTDRVVSLSRTRAAASLGDAERWREMLMYLPLDRLIEPAEIANAACFLASDACGYVSGTVLDIDGGSGAR